MCTRITDRRGDRALYNKANDGMTENLMLHFSQLRNFGCGSLPEGRLHSSMHEKEPSQSFTSHDQSADRSQEGWVTRLRRCQAGLHCGPIFELRCLSFQYISMIVLTFFCGLSDARRPGMAIPSEWVPRMLSCLAAMFPKKLVNSLSLPFVRKSKSSESFCRLHST